jgi:hypothetical protein
VAPPPAPIGRSSAAPRGKQAPRTRAGRGRDRRGAYASRRGFFAFPCSRPRAGGAAARAGAPDAARRPPLPQPPAACPHARSPTPRAAGPPPLNPLLLPPYPFPAGAAGQSYIAGAPQTRTYMPLKAAQEPSGGRNPCEMGLTFFPRDAENLPTGWSQAVQQAGGNTQTDQLMKIALAGYPIPQLYMAPVSVYTAVGGSVPATCVTGQGTPGAGVLVRPAAYTITWALAGQSGQLGPFLKGSKQDPPPNVTLNFVPQLPDVSRAGRGGGGGGAVRGPGLASGRPARPPRGGGGGGVRGAAAGAQRRAAPAARAARCLPPPLRLLKPPLT